MAIIMKMAAFWACECCKAEWFMTSDRAPRQCSKCGSRRWNEGEAAEVGRYLQSLVVRHINPYRKPLSYRQKAAILRLKAQSAVTRAAKQAAGPTNA